MQPNSPAAKQQTARVQVQVDAAAQSRCEAMKAYVGLACRNECDSMMRMLDDRFGCQRRQPNETAPTLADAKIEQCLQAARAWKAVANGMQVQQEWTVFLQDPVAKSTTQPVPFTVIVSYSSIQDQHKAAAQATSPPLRMTGLQRPRSESTEYDRVVRQRVDDQEALDLSECCSHIEEDEIEMFLDEESIRLVEEQLEERDSEHLCEESLDDQELEDLLSQVLS